MFFLKRKVRVEASVEAAWEFIGDPRNLNRITPPEMDFQFISEPPRAMYGGLLIAYRVKLPLLGYQSWVSEIKHITAGESFVDEQREGPYKFWYHYHKLEREGDDAVISDRVAYALPFGLLGRVAGALFVEKELKRIFDYREKALVEYFKN